jgi:hypothetical protein
MSNPRSFEVVTEKQAVATLNYFNAFHDGFIKSMVITSHDRIEADHSQACTGVFDVEMDLAHYNYAVVDSPEPAPFHDHDQIVRATFRNAQEVFCDLREAMCSHTIISLDITSGERQLATGLPTERCLCLHHTRHHLVDNRRWETRSYQLLTFSEATFRQLASKHG